MNDNSYKGLGSYRTAQELLDMYFLDVRSALLETAATLDRIERSPGGKEIFGDPRLKQVMQTLDLLINTTTNRAEQMQLLFSER